MNWKMIKNSLVDDWVPTIRDAIPASWTPERMVRSISRELRHERSTVLGSVLFLGVGVVVGGALALLLAPKTGQDLRADLSSRLHKIQRNNSRERDVSQV